MNDWGSLSQDDRNVFERSFEDVFWILRKHHSELLAALRDGDPGSDFTEAWLRAHRLYSPWMATRLEKVRAYWRQHDRAAERLEIGVRWMHATLRSNTAEREAEWKKSVDPWPRPRETLQEWRRRSDDLFRQLRKIQGATASRLSPERELAARLRHAEWFVQRQVCGLSDTDIAASSEKDDSTIKKALRDFAKVTGVQLRRTPRERIPH